MWAGGKICRNICNLITLKLYCVSYFTHLLLLTSSVLLDLRTVLTIHGWFTPVLVQWLWRVSTPSISSDLVSIFIVLRSFSFICCARSCFSFYILIFCIFIFYFLQCCCCHERLVCVFFIWSTFSLRLVPILCHGFYIQICQLLWFLLLRCNAYCGWPAVAIWSSIWEVLQYCSWGLHWTLGPLWQQRGELVAVYTWTNALAFCPVLQRRCLCEHLLSPIVPVHGAACNESFPTSLFEVLRIFSTNFQLYLISNWAFRSEKPIFSIRTVMEHALEICRASTESYFFHFHPWRVPSNTYEFW